MSQQTCLLSSVLSTHVVGFLLTPWDCDRSAEIEGTSIPRRQVHCLHDHEQYDAAVLSNVTEFAAGVVYLKRHDATCKTLCAQTEHHSALRRSSW